MPMKADVLKRIIDAYKGDDLAGHLASELALIESIHKRRMIIRDDYRRAEEEIDGKLSDLQRDCKHLVLDELQRPIQRK